MAIGEYMSQISLKDRWEFLQGLVDNEDHLNKDFKFKFIENFDVTEIKNILESYKEEWDVEIHTKELYQTQKDTNSIVINWVPNSFHSQHLPFEVERLEPNEKLYELVMSVAKKLESIYNGKSGRIWIARLPAGKEIPNHVDHYDHFINVKAVDELYSLAVHRIQLCITTNDDVWFDIDGSKLHMNPGEIWEINHHIQHYVENNGDTDRIHICIDILPYKWL